MKHTVYIAIEIESKTKMDATAKVATLLSGLSNKKEVGETQIFMTDERSIKNMSPGITFILYEIAKVESITKDVLKGALETFNKVFRK